MTRCDDGTVKVWMWDHQRILIDPEPRNDRSVAALDRSVSPRATGRGDHPGFLHRPVQGYGCSTESMLRECFADSPTTTNGLVVRLVMSL